MFVPQVQIVPFVSVHVPVPVHARPAPHVFPVAPPPPFVPPPPPPQV